MTSVKEVIINVLNTNYPEWRTEAPLPPVLLCMCMEYIVVKGKRQLKNGTQSHMFLVDGKIHGEYKEWWKNGNKCSEKTYVYGKKHGESRTWYSTGEQWSHEYYVDGKPHGEWKIWTKDGTLLVHRLYTDGKIVGQWKTQCTLGGVKIIDSSKK